MLRTLLSIFVLLFLLSCGSNLYLLNSEGDDHYYLQKIIDEAANEGKISKRPRIMIDRTMLSYINYQKHRISKCDIITLEIRDLETSKLYYGEHGRGGVIEITTARSFESFYQDNTLYIIGDRRLTKEEVEALEPDWIKQVQVISEQDKIKKITTEDYEKVIRIYLKKDIK